MVFLLHQFLSFCSCSVRSNLCGVANLHHSITPDSGLKEKGSVLLPHFVMHLNACHHQNFINVFSVSCFGVKHREATCRATSNRSTHFSWLRSERHQTSDPFQSKGFFDAEYDGFNDTLLLFHEAKAEKVTHPEADDTQVNRQLRVRLQSQLVCLSKTCGSLMDESD